MCVGSGTLLSCLQQSPVCTTLSSLRNRNVLLSYGLHLLDRGWMDSQPIKVDGHLAEDSDMLTLSQKVLLRYGYAVVSVGLAAALCWPWIR